MKRLLAALVALTGWLPAMAQEQEMTPRDWWDAYYINFQCPYLGYFETRHLLFLGLEANREHYLVAGARKEAKAAAPDTDCATLTDDWKRDIRAKILVDLTRVALLASSELQHESEKLTQSVMAAYGKQAYGDNWEPLIAEIKADLGTPISSQRSAARTIFNDTGAALLLQYTFQTQGYTITPWKDEYYFRVTRQDTDEAWLMFKDGETYFIHDGDFTRDPGGLLLLDRDGKLTVMLYERPKPYAQEIPEIIDAKILTRTDYDPEPDARRRWNSVDWRETATIHDMEPVADCPMLACFISASPVADLLENVDDRDSVELYMRSEKSPPVEATQMKYGTVRHELQVEHLKGAIAMEW